jgi:hypothetical protein
MVVGVKCVVGGDLQSVAGKKKAYIVERKRF